jgi:glyoxylase-like metal-dependent hydrolase (beta-lactamase superfamily II)
MKKILKISGIVIGVLVLLFLGSFIYLYKFYMTTIPTGKVYNNLYAIETSMVDFFVYTDGSNYIAFDAGLDEASVKSEMKKINIDPDKITHVFLTHSDSDHAGGIAAFKNAKVYISKTEEPFVTEKKLRKTFFGEKFNKLNVKYQTFKDREIIELGKTKIKAVVNPGHTEGSTTFFINDSIMLTGDILILKNGKAEALELFNMDTPTALKSIKMLGELSDDIKILCTAHSGCSNDMKKVFGK